MIPSPGCIVLSHNSCGDPGQLLELFLENAAPRACSSGRQLASIFRSSSMQTNKTTNRTHQQHRTTHQTNREDPTTMNERTRPVSELFDQAMSSYEQAFRTGLRLQE